MVVATPVLAGYRGIAVPPPQVLQVGVRSQAELQQRSVSATERRYHRNPNSVIPAKYLPRTITYNGNQAAGTVIIDTRTRHLYHILGGGKARRYGVGVGRPGFEWAGSHRVTAKKQWPDWRPPSEMLARQPELPAFVPGGPDNPLGARALYLGSTLYRIHGSNEPWTIGKAVSSGCIRMRNEDVVELYKAVPEGALVIVR
ncbi:L,D-transpeptidase [Polycladidibacter hongkongensis]|uniref:L,D-transpeptidase n=1 Tax=Polycladidibacter hongkongensis TaxID=1647556 RepID=UPI000A644803|nr:L,D-transpeptidase [Pseudovibrio hongkongensis]